jgi:toxin ParE1/3/4
VPVPRNRVEKRPQAIRDLADIAVYLAEESGSDELAFRFLDAAEASFDSLAAMSEMGTSRTYNSPALVGVRMWRAAGFPNHLIFYRPIESGVEVIRVLHANRDIESLFGGRG